MEKNKIIQISAVILLIESAIAMVYGIVAFILPDLLVSRSFPLATGQSWENMLNVSPEIVSYILILEGMAGGLGFTAIVGSLFVILIAFRKGEKWAWFYLMIIGITGWGNNLIGNILMKNNTVILIIVCGLALHLAALIFSAKAILFGKET
jgi:hypothetical protein